MSDKLRLEWIDPETLTPNPANWRRHPKAQKEAVEAVVDQVGWAGALLFNEGTNRLIDGHLRREIDHDGPVPVLIGNWTEEQERLILATLDPIAALAEAESDALDALLETVETESEAVKALLERLAEDDSPFSPSLNPTSAGGIVTDDDIERERQRLEGRFEDTDVDQVEVTCPHCAEIFFLNKRDIL